MQQNKKEAYYNTLTASRSRLFGQSILEFARNLLQSSSYYILFISWSFACGALGPTLLWLTQRVNSDIGSMGFVVTLRNVGSAICSLFIGKIYELLESKFHSIGVHSFLLFSFLIFAGIHAVIPLMPNFALLLVHSLFFGIFSGAINIGGNILIAKLWGKNVTSFMIFLHFSFGAGSLLAPLFLAWFSSHYDLSYYIGAIIVVVSIGIIAFVQVLVHVMDRVLKKVSVTASNGVSPNDSVSSLPSSNSSNHLNIEMSEPLNLNNTTIKSSTSNNSLPIHEEEGHVLHHAGSSGDLQKHNNEGHNNDKEDAQEPMDAGTDNDSGKLVIAIDEHEQLDRSPREGSPRGDNVASPAVAADKDSKITSLLKNIKGSIMSRELYICLLTACGLGCISMLESNIFTFVCAYFSEEQISTSDQQTQIMFSVFWVAFTSGRLISGILASCLPSWLILMALIALETIGMVMWLIAPMKTAWYALALVGVGTSAQYPTLLSFPSTSIKGLHVSTTLTTLMLFIPILLSCFSPNITSSLISKLGYSSFWKIEVVLFAFQVFFILVLIGIGFASKLKCWRAEEQVEKKNDNSNDVELKAAA